MGRDASVFGVNFADGRIKAYPKMRPGRGENRMFVRYVRGNPADYPQGMGPQGDVRRIYNLVRLVRSANGTATPRGRP